MKSIALSKSGLAMYALLLSATSFSQIQPEPAPSVKGRWGLSTGLNLDSYKTDISLPRKKNSLGVLPMVTYTYGKNQFELGPQFLLANSSARNIYRYFGMNFNYKRYFNGFGNCFVPYLFTGVGFSTTSSNTVVEENGVTYGRYPYNFKQTGIHAGIGYGLEWQIGRCFYLGSSVSFNAGVFSIRKSDFMINATDYFGGMQLSNETRVKFDFNVNMQIGYRFGGKK